MMMEITLLYNYNAVLRVGGCYHDDGDNTMLYHCIESGGGGGSVIMMMEIMLLLTI